MTAFRERRIGRLSVGQQQRAFIARALASEAELLILDEPTAAVDAATQEEFYHLLERLNRDRGMTIMLVEHDLAMVAAHVGSIALLNRRIVFRGTPRRVRRARFPARRSTRADHLRGPPRDPARPRGARAGRRGDDA